MKFTISKFIIVSLLAVIPFFSYSQDNPCEKFRNGIYRMAGITGDDYVIMRKGNKQIESKAGDNTKLEFKVEWLDDCTYTLTPDSSTAGNLNLPDYAVLKVKITSSTDKSYKFICIPNFSKVEQKGEMIQLKK